MDAVTLAAAALAIVVDESRDAALRQALLERERLAMAVEDRDSFLAQRYFTGSMQLRGAAGHRPQTWQAAYVRGARRQLPPGGGRTAGGAGGQPPGRRGAHR